MRRADPMRARMERARATSRLVRGYCWPRSIKFARGWRATWMAFRAGVYLRAAADWQANVLRVID